MLNCSSSNIGFEHLSNLTQLEELKVRAVSKMMVDGGLEAFSHLKNLKSLVSPHLYLIIIIETLFLLQNLRILTLKTKNLTFFDLKDPFFTSFFT